MVHEPRARSAPPPRTLRELAGPGLYAIVALLVSLALLNTQVTVTRLLAYRFFYHFVFFVISLAQLGLAAAGAFVYASGRTSWGPRELLGWLLLLAATPLAVLTAYGWFAPAPNLSFAKLDGPTAWGYLTLLALLLVVLNFAGGMVLTQIFTSWKESIGRLYAADLLGAALGCLVSVGAMQAAGPIRALLLSGLAALAAAVWIARIPAVRAPGGGGRALGLAAGAIGLLLLAGAAVPRFFDPWVRLPGVERRVVRSDWTHLARTDALAPGSYVIDGDASTHLGFGGPRPDAPEYELVPPEPQVAIVGAGAGPQLRVALQHRAASVLAIDINPTIVRWSLEDDARFNRGIFRRPNVQVEVGEGRHVLRSSGREFDLVVMHAIDTWTASSQGAYSLTENFLYTSEAMRDLLSRLRPGGVVSIRRWLFWPPRENLRLFTTVLDALEQEGLAEPERHVVVVSPEAHFRNPELKVWGYVFFSNRPFEEDRLEKLDAYVEARNWQYLYRPGRAIDTPFSEFVNATDRDAFYATYPYIVTPARDANPFFFQFASPWSSWGGGERLAQAIYSQSSSLLLLCLAIAGVLTVLLLGGPLFVRRRDAAGDPQLVPALVYFGSLGLGFMAFELPAIQVMTLLLGHPTYALSVVLLGLLAAAGLGSTLMGRASDATGRAALVVVVGLAIASGLGLLPAVHAAIDLPGPARVGLTLVYLTAIGVPLGMPFVAGVRLLDPSRPHQVAWAWAVNGATAVVGSCLLMILMVFRGSGAGFAVAAAAYALAFVARTSLAARRDTGGPR